MIAHGKISFVLMSSGADFSKLYHMDTIMNESDTTASLRWEMVRKLGSGNRIKNDPKSIDFEAISLGKGHPKDILSPMPLLAKG